MILASLGIISVSRGVSDADAQAFITAANITDNTQKNSINQLVIDLKSANGTNVYFDDFVLADTLEEVGANE